MATATAPAVRDEIDVRWEMVMYGRPERGDTGSESITMTLTKRFDRVQDSLEEIAASLVPDGVWGDEAQEDEDSLQHLMGETWDAIERLLKDWAARAPERRNRIQENVKKAGTAA